MTLEQQLQGINIYLVGMMGAGKSTVGKVLARELGYRFFDTDDLIGRVTGRSIPEIFETDGEAGFRTWESQVLGELCSYRRLVVATGGGIVIEQMNWSYLRHGIVIWLDVPPDRLFDRLQGDTSRPLLQHPDPLGRLKDILEQRRSRYAQADLSFTIENDDTPEEISQRILTRIPKILKATPMSSS
ncbi:shikimate kinase [Lyngbya sp. CCY1209]|uniref:shikimate kinase n=1 Tax=Lyngbya sp. CCY1209 TaxID=2886103 RepID=UPI002D206C71|nr:shikimate kinase [Lyngbya sp. CCY1209]MEB3884662.1 shikimate kinase [Lyngbya sp. CCY1209]